MGLVLLDKVVGEGKVQQSRMVVSRMVSRMYLNMMRRERGGNLSTGWIFDTFDMGMVVVGRGRSFG